MRTVKVYWSMPMDIERFFASEESKDIGFYYITQKLRGKEKPLYIGKSYHSFKSRMKIHEYWLKEYRGEILIRLERIISPNWYFWEEYRQLINETESILIYNMRDVLRENVSNTKSVRLSEDTLVINFGHSSIIPKRIRQRA